MLRTLLSKVGLYRPRPGDVVRDRYDRTLKTVERATADRVEVVWFDLGGALRRGSLLRRNAEFVR